MYQEPRRFFARELLLLIIGFITIAVTAALTGAGGAMIVVAIVLNVALVLIYLVMFLIAVVHFFKFLGDKENQHTPIMYIVNPIFAFVVLGGFLLFYILLAALGAVVLLPFLG